LSVPGATLRVSPRLRRPRPPPRRRRLDPRDRGAGPGASHVAHRTPPLRPLWPRRRQRWRPRSHPARRARPARARAARQVQRLRAARHPHQDRVPRRRRMGNEGLSPRELRTLAALKTPERIQRFLDTEIAYNKEPDGDTLRSPRRVLRDRVAHCFEGALLAAAALRVQGDPPLLLDLESVRDDDHVLALFRRDGHWGAIGKSNFSGLRFREPVYR